MITVLQSKVVSLQQIQLFTHLLEHSLPASFGLKQKLDIYYDQLSNKTS